MKLTRERAKEFSMLHWKEKVKNNGQPLGWKKLRELGIYDLHANCGYCEKYIYTYSKTLLNCAKCPIRPKIKDYDDLDDTGCMQKCHPFNKWYFNSTKTTAQAVLTLIEKS